MSEEIPEAYAGCYARPVTHMDNKVMIHLSAATEKRPAGTIIQSPGGWYDAGDYNKYVVNPAFSVSMMLYSYEMNKEYFDRMVLNIPESNNNIPDILDEIMVNMRWRQCKTLTTVAFITNSLHQTSRDSSCQRTVISNDMWFRKPQQSLLISLRR